MAIQCFPIVDPEFFQLVLQKFWQKLIWNFLVLSSVSNSEVFLLRFQKLMTWLNQTLSSQHNFFHDEQARLRAASSNGFKNVVMCTIISLGRDIIGKKNSLVCFGGNSINYLHSQVICNFLCKKWFFVNKARKLPGCPKKKLKSIWKTWAECVLELQSLFLGAS